MASFLPRRKRGGLRPSLTITWTREDEDETPENLTGATMTGTMTDRSGTARPIAGTLTVTDATAGQFRWDFAAADLAELGTFNVEFTATFETAPTPAKSFDAELTVV